MTPMNPPSLQTLFVRHALTLALPTLVVLALSSAPAFAEVVVVKVAKGANTEADFQRAKQSTLDAQKAFSNGDEKLSLAHANAAYRLYPNASTAMFVATVYKEFGKARRAYEWALRARNHDPSEVLLETVVTFLKTMGGPLGLGVLRIDTGTQTSAVVTVDGTPTPAGAFVGASAGKHRVEVSAEGFVTVTREVSVTKGASELMVVNLKRMPETPRVEEGSSGGISGAGLGLIIGGVVAAGAGVGLHVWGASQDGSADDMTGNWGAGVSYEDSLAQYESLRDDGEMGSYIAYGLYGLGAALIVAGAVVWALDGGEASGEGKVGVGAGPISGPGSFGAVLSGGF